MYNPKQNKTKLREREIRFVVTSGKGNWIKVVKSYKLPVIRYVNSQDALYNMMSVVNTAILIYEREKILRVLITRKKFYFFLLYLYEMTDGN